MKRFFIVLLYLGSPYAFLLVSRWIFSVSDFMAQNNIKLIDTVQYFMFEKPFILSEITIPMWILTIVFSIGAYIDYEEYVKKYQEKYAKSD